MLALAVRSVLAGCIVAAVLIALGVRRRIERRPGQPFGERPAIPSGRGEAYVNLRQYLAAPEGRRTHARPTAPPTSGPASPIEQPAGPLEPAATGKLRSALDDPDPFVRIRMIAGLVEQTGADAMILTALSDDYPQVRREAVRALGRVGGDAAIRALADSVQDDPSAEVREEAAAALSALLDRSVAGEDRGPA